MSLFLLKGAEIPSYVTCSTGLSRPDEMFEKHFAKYTLSYKIKGCVFHKLGKVKLRKISEDL